MPLIFRTTSAISHYSHSSLPFKLRRHFYQIGQKEGINLYWYNLKSLCSLCIDQADCLERKNEKEERGHSLQPMEREEENFRGEI